MASQPRILLIINNQAAKAHKVWPVIKGSLEKNQINFETHVTKQPGDATVATRAALRAGYDIIAVVGGDGTLSEAAAGFFALDESVGEVPRSINEDAVLAILPSGTGDDFARGLRGRRVALQEWIASLVSYGQERDQTKTKLVDVIYGITSGGSARFICINISTIGLGAEVARRVGAQGKLTQKMSGELRFLAAACGALAGWRERKVRITIDDKEVVEGRSNLLAVANGIYAGGGMMFAPSASLDDGQLDLLISQDITRGAIVRELPRIRRGTHLANPNVRVVQAIRVRIETFGRENELLVEADGNVRGTTPAEFLIMPGALRLVL